MKNGGQPVGKTRWHRRQSEFSRPRIDFSKKADASKSPPPTPAEPQEIETVDVANMTGSQLMAGSTLGDVGQTAQKIKGNKLAGQRCQAPKGDGICGAVISRHNPHAVPICQPCAERLASEALRRGENPDLSKIWNRLEAKRRAKEKATELASRPSGVHETQIQSVAEAGEPPPEVSVA